MVPMTYQTVYAVYNFLGHQVYTLKRVNVEVEGPVEGFLLLSAIELTSFFLIY